MVIGADDGIHKFGTQDTVDSSSAAVLDDAFSVAGDVTQWTNDDDAPMASMVAMLDWSVAPTANTSVHLYARLDDIDSTNDQDTPDGNYRHTLLGSFPINDVTTNQYIAIDIALPNTVTSQRYTFFIENQTGQTIQAGWTLKITPKTIGPHA